MIPRQLGEFLPTSMLVDKPVYHYTSAEGLLGTISKHSLRATEAFGLNDVGELRHGWAFIREWLAEQDQTEVLVQTLLQWTPQEGDASVGAGVYLICASTASDDASQWRLYADSGRGYTLEIDPIPALAVGARLDAYPDKEPPLAGRFGTLVRDSAIVSPWLSVLYSAEEKRFALSYFLEAAREAYQEMEGEAARTPVEERPSVYDDFAERVQSDLVTLAQCMKASAFSGESEVRAVATLAVNAHAEFRATQYGVVRYVNLVAADTSDARPHQVLAVDPGQQPHPLPILSIGLGPGQVVSNSRDAALALMGRHGYPEQVTVSDAALR